MDRRAIGRVAVPASSRRRRGGGGAAPPASSVPTAQHFSPASCRRRSGCSAPRLTLGSATATASTTATAARNRLAHSLYRANAKRLEVIGGLNKIIAGLWQALYKVRK